MSQLQNAAGTFMRKKIIFVAGIAYNGFSIDYGDVYEKCLHGTFVQTYNYTHCTVSFFLDVHFICKKCNYDEHL